MIVEFDFLKMVFFIYSRDAHLQEFRVVAKHRTVSTGLLTGLLSPPFSNLYGKIYSRTLITCNDSVMKENRLWHNEFTLFFTLVLVVSF